MRPRLPWLVLAAAAAAVTGCGDGRRDARPAASAAVRCAIDAGPCATDAPGLGPLSLEIAPRPVRSLTDLVFVVRAPALPGDGADLTLELRMPGMAMGVNRVALRPVAPGRYEGRGAIVRCPSGRRDWEAAILGRFPGAAHFAFEVDRP